MQTFLNAIEQKLFDGTNYGKILVIVNQSKIRQSELNENILQHFQSHEKLPFHPQVFTVDASNISTTNEFLPELQNKDPNKSRFVLLIITNINNTPIDTNNESINILERKQLDRGPIKILATMHSPQQNNEAVEQKITQIFGQNVLNQNIMYTGDFLLEEDADEMQQPEQIQPDANINKDNINSIIDIVLMLIIGIVTGMNIVLLSWLYSPNVSPNIKKKLKTISYSVIITSVFSIIFCGIFYYFNDEIKYKQIIAVMVGLIHSLFIGFAVYLLTTNHKK